MEYVLGYLFSMNLDRVALIQKNRPDHLAGKWNGIGGKIEENEKSLYAMRREFFEETGLYVARWLKFDEFPVRDGLVHCFFSMSALIDRVETRTDEQVAVLKVIELNQYPHNDNLIPMIAKATVMANHFEAMYRDQTIDAERSCCGNKTRQMATEMDVQTSRANSKFS